MVFRRGSGYWEKRMGKKWDYLSAQKAARKAKRDRLKAQAAAIAKRRRLQARRTAWMMLRRKGLPDTVIDHVFRLMLHQR